MSDDLVTRLRELNTAVFATQPNELCNEAADEIERLQEWKDLAYEMRNKSWWAMRNKVLMKFDFMHKTDWKRYE